VTQEKITVLDIQPYKPTQKPILSDLVDLKGRSGLS